jgi:hypothetical protein
VGYRGRHPDQPTSRRHVTDPSITPPTGKRTGTMNTLTCIDQLPVRLGSLGQNRQPRHSSLLARWSHGHERKMPSFASDPLQGRSRVAALASPAGIRPPQTALSGAGPTSWNHSSPDPTGPVRRTARSRIKTPQSLLSDWRPAATPAAVSGSCQSSDPPERVIDLGMHAYAMASARRRVHG